MFTASLVSLALGASLLGIPHASAPVAWFDTPQIPTITAEQWIVYDADTDVILAAWNVDEQTPMASVTKVMTAIVVLENADLATRITIPELAAGTQGASAGLVEGERWTLGDLLIAMLVRSGNDTAVALAHYVGGGSVATFVDMMNARAVTFGMSSTRFANPHGLDSDGHYSTARDLLTLTAASQDYPEIRRITRIRLVTIPIDPSEKPKSFTNTNKLLGAYPGVTGLKTGNTNLAGKVLLLTSQRRGRNIYTVVMRSDDHFADTRELLDWAYSTYSIRDRWLRLLYGEGGDGPSLALDLDLPSSEERRLRALPPLQDGRWSTSSLEDLPKGASIGRWLRGAIPDVASGD